MARTDSNGNPNSIGNAAKCSLRGGIHEELKAIFGWTTDAVAAQTIEEEHAILSPGNQSPTLNKAKKLQKTTRVGR